MGSGAEETSRSYQASQATLESSSSGRLTAALLVPQPGALSTGQALPDEVLLPCPHGISASSCHQGWVRTHRLGPPPSGRGAPAKALGLDSTQMLRPWQGGAHPTPSPALTNSKLCAGGSRDCGPEREWKG